MRRTSRHFFLVLLAATLLLLAPTPAAPQDDAFDNVGRIVAIGDVHGDLEQFLSVLRSAGLVNEKRKWAGGKTHLVQTGDIPDRGPDTRKIMDLLMDLEQQAKKAGGRVHCLLGNHEAMNIYGDLRYVTPEEYAAYRTTDSERIREQFYEDELRSRPSTAPKPDEAFRKQWEGQYPLGWFEHRFNFGLSGKYGKWLLNHNAVLRINKVLFLHGGLSPKYTGITIRGFNDQVRAELKDWTKLTGGMVTDSDGPLWYRGLATEPEGELSAHVDQMLAAHGVEHIVMGHTPTAGAIMPRFGGKVILIDVGMSKFYGGPPACLAIEGTKFLAMHRGRPLELPVGGGDVLAYLKAAAALEAPDSRLARVVQAGAGVAAVGRDDP